MYKIYVLYRSMATMQLLTSQQVQTGFGKFSDLVKQQGREPVIITQRKRPTMAVFRYDEAMEMMRLTAKMRFLQALRENANDCQEPSDEELTDLNRLIDEEREIIYQEKIKKNARK